MDNKKRSIRIKINLDKHDLLQTRNSILLRLETAKDLLTIDSDIETTIVNREKE